MLPGEAPEAAVRRVADQEGRELGEAAMKHARSAKGRDPLGAVLPPLERLGFEPERAGGEVLLRNCPFHDLVDAHRGLVCAMNHALLSGLVAAMDRPEVAAHSREPDASCCVALTAGG
jgi:predicted ArsR family transcriptional regulator